MNRDVVSAIEPCFAPTYAEARAKFLKACGDAGVTPRAYVNPNKGPRAEDLACDVAWFGATTAKKIMLLMSATHGVEGYSGSGCQLDWLTGGGPADLPDDTAALIVHAINPHGFAWNRRVTEEGCDLNRNYVDFSAPLPGNPGHDELSEAFVPPDLGEATLAAAEARIKAYRDQHGELGFQAARKAGQYKHAHSMFFGGFEPTWARRTLEAIIADYDLPGRGLVAVVDYHTGLGPFGYGEPICGHKPDTLGMRMVMEMYGQSVGLPEAGTSVSIPLNGTSREMWNVLMGDKYAYVALEYGTYSPERGRLALRGDHWLHNQGPFDWDAPEAQRIKAAIRLQFHPDTDDWKEMVLCRSRQIQRQTLEGLARFGK